MSIDFRLEVVPIPVSDLDRAKRFYSEQAGYVIDLDTWIGDKMRLVQLTPPGSACSIHLSTGILNMPPGVPEGLQLVVFDIEAARSELVERAWRSARSSTWTTVSGLRDEEEIGTPSSSSTIRTATAGSCRSVLPAARPPKGERSHGESLNRVVDVAGRLHRRAKRRPRAASR